MLPLICTSNTQSHVDYGTPLIARKFTDYRTSTGTYHRFIPSAPGLYDCRVQAEIKPELKAIDATIQDDRKSLYNKTYVPLPHEVDPTETSNEKAPHLNSISYVRNIQEKMFKNPPPPIKPKLSEMKDSYRMSYYRPVRRDILAPGIESKCEIEGLARPLQSPIPPGQPGYWKYLDIYMTDNKLRYPAYTKEQMEQAREDVPTFYSASGVYKGLKMPLPGPPTGNKSIYDKTFFKYQLPLRCFSRAQKNVPNMKFKTEYTGSYVPSTNSDLHPYINSNGVQFEDSLAEAGPWQNLCAPGMYCTEYCHTGTGWPVRAVLDIGIEGPPAPHKNTSHKIKT